VDENKQNLTGVGAKQLSVQWAPPKRTDQIQSQKFHKTIQKKILSRIFDTVFSK